MVKEIAVSSGEHIGVVGPGILSVKSGSLWYLGTNIMSGNEIIVPKGKMLVFRVISDSEINTNVKEIKKIDKNPIPEEWTRVIDRIADERLEKVMVLGAPDTGKSTFSLLASNLLVTRGRKVAVIDSDVGQSDVGPPCTVGMTILREQVIDFSECPLECSYFVGSNSPSKHLLQVVVGVRKCLDTSSMMADHSIIDTSGMVFGGVARALKIFKADVVEPDLIVALQRDNEIEHILSQLPYEIERIPVSELCRRTSPEERRFLRERSLIRYFEGCKEIEISLEDVKVSRCFLWSGKPISIDELEHDVEIVHAEKNEDMVLIIYRGRIGREVLQYLKKRFEDKVRLVNERKLSGLLLGLSGSRGDLLGLGILTRIDFKGQKMRIRTKVNPEEIEVVQFGSMRLDENGREIEKLSPGFI